MKVAWRVQRDGMCIGQGGRAHLFDEGARHLLSRLLLHPHIDGAVAHHLVRLAQLALALLRPQPRLFHRALQLALALLPRAQATRPP